MIRSSRRSARCLLAAFALILGATAFASTPALAERHDRGGHDRGHHWRGHPAYGYGAPAYGYAPPPVVYAPPGPPAALNFIIPLHIH